MTHPSLEGYDIDRDYIDPPTGRANITVDGESAQQFEQDTDYVDSETKSQIREGMTYIFDQPDRPEQAEIYERQARHQTAQEHVPDQSYLFNRDDDAMSGTAYDVVIDRRAVSDRDDRGGTRTGMDPNEAGGYYAQRIIRDGKTRTRASWLNLLQDGYRDKRRAVENSKMDYNGWIDTFCANLDLTPYQKQRVRKIITDVNLNHFGPYTVEMVVLATISLVAEADGRFIRDERAYHKLVMGVDTSLKTIKNIRSLLHEKSQMVPLNEDTGPGRGKGSNT